MNVSTRNLSFAYSGGKFVLTGINFEIGDQEIVGIVGGSGCGKSTLLRIIAGILPRTKSDNLLGSVTFNEGRDLNQLRSSGDIGFMFQDPSLLPNLTVAENVSLPLAILSAGKPCGKDVEDLIDMVGLRDFKDFLPRQLSGGMQTRTVLARTFATKPDFLLLDEPFSALDYGWKVDLYDKLLTMLRSFKSSGIMVSHDVGEVFLLSNRVLVMSRAGTIISEHYMGKAKPSGLDARSIHDYLETVKDEVIAVQSEILRDKEAFK